MYNRLFLLDFTLAVGTIEFTLTPSDKHEYSPSHEIMPLTVMGYVFITTDLGTARTITISLSLHDRVDNLFLYGVTPDLDNNTIRIKPVMATDDSAIALITDMIGTLEHGFVATQGTALNHVGSGAIGAGDTCRIQIIYEAEEFATFRNFGTATIDDNLTRHLELGVIHKN